MTQSTSYTFAIASLATLVAMYIVRKQSQKKENSRVEDILNSVLVDSLPLVAAKELEKEGKTLTCERRLGDRQLIISADAKVADYVFNGPNRSNFVRRPADDVGLKELGMLKRGLIWNNDVTTWQQIRGCFQFVLDEALLKQAVSMAGKECRSLLDELHPDKADGLEVNMLEVCRKSTFRATLWVFFGVKPAQFASVEISEDSFIEAIIAYFKAWEYFLFRSSQNCDSERLSQHQTSVQVLRHHVRELLKLPARMKTDDTNIPTKRSKRVKPLFVDKLRSICQDDIELLEQSTLEMLLAGTDTSSVTAYYTLLGIAGNASLQDSLYTEIQRQGSSLLKRVVDETLRIKPVGPVVLRQAVDADPAFPFTKLDKDAAVLVHLAEMNIREEYWNDPLRFDPHRETRSKTFFPFGEGPKGCVGMHLGQREVFAIVSTVVANFTLHIHGEYADLMSLKTHWDIAMQPDAPTPLFLKPRKRI